MSAYAGETREVLRIGPLQAEQLAVLADKAHDGNIDSENDIWLYSGGPTRSLKMTALYRDCTDSPNMRQQQLKYKYWDHSKNSLRARLISHIHRVSSQSKFPESAVHAAVQYLDAFVMNGVMQSHISMDLGVKRLHFLYKSKNQTKSMFIENLAMACLLIAAKMELCEEVLNERKCGFLDIILNARSCIGNQKSVSKTSNLSDMENIVAAEACVFSALEHVIGKPTAWTIARHLCIPFQIQLDFLKTVSLSCAQESLMQHFNPFVRASAIVCVSMRAQRNQCAETPWHSSSLDGKCLPSPHSEPVQRLVRFLAQVRRRAMRESGLRCLALHMVCAKQKKKIESACATLWKVYVKNKQKKI